MHEDLVAEYGFEAFIGEFVVDEFDVAVGEVVGVFDGFLTDLYEVRAVRDEVEGFVFLAALEGVEPDEVVVENKDGLLVVGDGSLFSGEGYKRFEVLLDFEFKLFESGMCFEGF